jgi:hypothetical protein
VVGLVAVLVLGAAPAMASSGFGALPSGPAPTVSSLGSVPGGSLERQTIRVRRSQLRAGRGGPRLARGVIVLPGRTLAALDSAVCLTVAANLQPDGSPVCARYRLLFARRTKALAGARAGGYVVAGASRALPDGLLIRIVRVVPQKRGLVIDGTPAMINQVIRGGWAFRVRLPVSRAMIARARTAPGVRLADTPFPAQRRLIAEQHRHRHGGRGARIADQPIVGPQPKGWYVQLNNFDLGALPGSGGRFHLYLTGYATVDLSFSIGTDTRDCAQNSCPHTAWHWRPISAWTCRRCSSRSPSTA